MLYIFFAITCLCSSYMIAMETEQQGGQVKNKEYYDKILDDKIKDPQKRARYEKEGYTVVRSRSGIDVDIVPLLLPLDHPMHAKLEKIEENKKAHDVSLTKER